MVLIRKLPTKLGSAVNLINLVNKGSCPCHQTCNSATTTTVNTSKEYAFEISNSTIRYGEGVSNEVGYDLKNMKANKVLLFTDANVSKLPQLPKIIESIENNGVEYKVFDRVRCEPTDQSWQEAIDFSKEYQPDAIVAFGGGSTIDTAKAANLLTVYKDKVMLDFVNAPIGRNLAVDRKLLPLIAIPTTSGTGSETTGSAIFDYLPLKTKTGIADRALKPILGLVDPLNVKSMPRDVQLASGLDVLCHAMESFTALPYYDRTPRPQNPLNRPSYQGSNPISDLWSIHALKIVIENLPKIIKNSDDTEAGNNMLLAATYAGIGFGNAGVHLCHGMSYPISGLNKSFQMEGYKCLGHNLVPHGISVALTAPSVFQFTSVTNVERHKLLAQLFGANINNLKEESVGSVLADQLRQFLSDLNLPDGLGALGYTGSDLDKLVQGTLPQHRVTKLSPKPIDATILHNLFENSLKLF